LAGTNNPGGVSEISTAGVVLRTIDFGPLGIASCSPTGLAVGASGELMVGCGNVGAAAILLNPTGSGSIVKTFAGLGGTDELHRDAARIRETRRAGVHRGGASERHENIAVERVYRDRMRTRQPKR
jgi:hypothetical protein